MSWRAGRGDMHSQLWRGVAARRNRIFAVVTRFSLSVVGLFAWTGHAGALPSFAEQTGQRCSACHVGGLGPQLTPFGRQFKLGGYTMRAGAGFTMPLAAMVVASYV